MALIVYWYDFICFGIITAAAAVSLWILWRREGAYITVDGAVSDRLLVGRPGSDVGFTQSRPQALEGPGRLWTSCWRGVHPGWLLLTRSASFLTMAVLLSWDVVEWGSSIFVYYTEWTFVLVMIYFGLGIVASAYGCWKRHSEEPLRDPKQTDLPAEEGRTSIIVPCSGTEIKFQDTHVTFQLKGRFWNHLMETIYQTCTGAVILTDVVFWFVIVPFLSNTHLGLNLLMGSMHTVNAILLLLDTSLNSLPFPWFRIAYFVQWSCLYVVFQWILHACGFTWWPYPFLVLNRPSAPIWYLCMAIVHIPCYGLYALIVKAKNSILPKLFPDSFVKPY